MSKLNSLFNNNRFVLILAFVLAVIIWFAVSIVYSPESTRTVAQIPVEFTFADETAGYRVFTDEQIFAKVDVSGKKYVVEQLSADSLVVSATVENISNSGMVRLELQAKKKTSGGDYTVVGVSPSSVSVMVDTERQLEYNVAIDCVGATVAEIKTENESLLLEPTFVNEDNAVLTVTGPDSQVSKISYVTAVAGVNKQLTKTERYTAGIIAYAADGTILFDANQGVSNLNYVTFSYEKAEIAANVNLRKIVPLTCSVVGAPENPPAVTLREMTGSDIKTDNEVSTIGIKGAVDVISKMDKVVLDGTVDFTKINPSDPMSFRFELMLPTIPGVTYDEYANLSDFYFVAMIESSGLVARSFDVPAEAITVKNLPAGYLEKVQSALKGITVVGPSRAVNSLTVDDVSVMVDGSAVTAAGALNLSPTITVTHDSRCWIIGSYQVVMEVTSR